MDECLACDLISGKRDLPGGRIYETGLWVVEHCIGEFPAGSLILKPFRHVTHVYELTAEEARELGPLLKKVTGAIQTATDADQIYVCLWSHAGWQPGHIHFVLQPVWNSQSEQFSNPGPFIQVQMFESGELPDLRDIERLSARVTEILRD